MHLQHYVIDWTVFQMAIFCSQHKLSEYYIKKYRDFWASRAIERTVEGFFVDVNFEWKISYNF